ncbi:MAG: gliding motility-associated C-terminal domain-containing protein, partial [Lewinella sp.]|nr:gliding motility-associated C-terminal domain-containing protein [Lewinella sp.]
FYIPNAITPNLDGINELFYVLSDYPNTSILDQFVVTDRNGEVLYSKASIPPGDVTHGWDGVTPAGSTYEGLFHFEIQVRDTLDILHTITGSACALPCGQKVIDPFMDSWLNCKFGLQHDGQGGFDEFLPSGETSCE